MIRMLLRNCPWCGESPAMDVTQDEFDRIQRWRNDELLIQQALPEWSAEKRELLLSSTHPDCWKNWAGAFDGDE